MNFNMKKGELEVEVDVKVCLKTVRLTTSHIRQIQVHNNRCMPENSITMVDSLVNDHFSLV